MFEEEFCQIKNPRLTFFPQYFMSAYWFLVGGVGVTVLLFKAPSVWWLTSPLLCSRFSLLPFESLIITCSGTSFSELILPRVHLMSLVYGLVDFVECGHYLSRYCFLPSSPSGSPVTCELPRSLLCWLFLVCFSSLFLDCASQFSTFPFTGCFLCLFKPAVKPCSKLFALLYFSFHSRASA